MVTSLETWDQSLVQHWGMLSLCGFENVFLKGPPPLLLPGLAYGALHRQISTNAAVKYLALLLGGILASWPGAAHAWRMN